MKMKKLQLGCYLTHKPGFETLDCNPMANPDIQWNLEFMPLPFDDNEYDEIVAEHTLEHIQKHKIVELFKELHRILKPGGRLYLSMPYVRHQSASANLLHYSTFDEKSLNVFTDFPQHRIIELEKPIFKVKSIRVVFGKFALIQRLLYWSRIFWCGGEIQYDLEVLK